MNLFDRLAIGIFGAVCVIATGLLFSVMMFMIDVTEFLISPIVYTSLFFAAITFVLGFIGKIDIVVTLITKPLHLLQMLLKLH